MHFWYRTTSYFAPFGKLFLACFFWNSSYTNFTVSQIIMQYSLCESIADLRDWRNSSVFQDDQVTDPLYVFFAMRRWRTPRPNLVQSTCSSRFKEFYPPKHVSLIRGACFILHHHPAMYFRKFDSLYPNEALFFTGCNRWVAYPYAWSRSTSLFPDTRLNNVMQPAASYPSSYAHVFTA